MLVRARESQNASLVYKQYSKANASSSGVDDDSQPSRGVRTGVTCLDESFDWLACPPTYIQSDPPGDGVPYNPWPLKSN